jgi:hypothetical protein
MQRTLAAPKSSRELPLCSLKEHTKDWNAGHVTRNTPLRALQAAWWRIYIQRAAPNPATVPFTHNVSLSMNIWIPCFFRFLGPESIQFLQKSIKSQ